MGRIKRSKLQEGNCYGIRRSETIWSVLILIDIVFRWFWFECQSKKSMLFLDDIVSARSETL